ncbi:hypothetical protein C2845_PM03G09010 [Panicum miliaceum]|uniref:Uncharacterized protein n=1 Tax=Panicum miliaceum TaxID=4540 RepID=A0A3L6T952_PANMI|nr:hypothetical protein C2845_PM03G09010 [Panicum miliaceum]
MGNCSCLERARVTAWDDDEDWGLPAAERSGGARGVAAAGNDGGGGMRVKIRMTKGQLRRLLESAGRGGASDEDVVAEIMRMAPCASTSPSSGTRPRGTTGRRPSSRRYRKTTWMNRLAREINETHS